MKIEVSNVSKTIRGISILEKINLTFKDGTIYGLIGKNGSGKTMLLRTISGLVVPTEGTISINRKLLHKDISFPENMGILIETPTFLNYLTGLDNLVLLAEIRNIVTIDVIKKYMEQFGLDPNLKLPVRKYSLGMKQKLGVIQAIMENPDILILDEPFNALDEISVKTLQDLLLQYKKSGKLIIVTSHHKDDIVPLCDNIYQMSDGKIM